MNKIVVVTLITLILTGIACQSKKKQIIIVPDIQKNHLERLHLKGTVQSVITQQYIKIDSNDLKLVSTTLYYYSLDGYLDKIVYKNEHDDTMKIRSVFYNDLAHETHWIESNVKGDTLASCLYEYDMNHFKRTEKYYQKDSLTYVLNYRTDGEGNVIALTRNNGEYSLTNKMYYNPLGLIERIEEYDPTGKRYKFITIEYDNYGDEVNRRVFKSENALIEYTYTKYDSIGRLLKITYEDKLHNSKEISEYFEHDKLGNWLLENLTISPTLHYIKKRQINFYKN